MAMQGRTGSANSERNRRAADPADRAPTTGKGSVHNGKGTGKAAGKAGTGKAGTGGAGTGQAGTGKAGTGGAETAKADGSHHPLGHVSVPGIGQTLPDLGMPNVAIPAVGPAVGHVVDVVRAHLPRTDRLVFYSGLGLAAMVGIVDLPVAAAIGVAVWVAARHAGREEPGGADAHHHAAHDETAKPAGRHATDRELSTAGTHQPVPGRKLPHGSGN